MSSKILSEAFRSAGADIDILASHQIRPVIREQSRLNSILIEAYATGKARGQLQGIEAAAKRHGFRYGVQTLLSFGGLASIHHPRLHEAMISGPIGGILGARHVGRMIEADSLVVSDMGGTSFDMGVITRGQVRIEHEPVMGRFKLNVPTIAMDLIGAGAGMIVKVDPDTGKISLGPESAGADPGPVCFGKGNLEPTICDCNAILGRLNPDYFLGGKVPLDVELAKRMFREKCADRLGVADIHEAAEGMAIMLEAEANTALRRILSSQGAHPSEFKLLSYGGSGPLHMAGYSRGIGFGDILTFKFAAAFSAFGCTTADFLKRRSRSISLEVPVEAKDVELEEVARTVSSVWDELKADSASEMKNDGHDETETSFIPFLLMRYTGQLEDVELISPLPRLRTPGDMRRLTASFSDHYKRINRSQSGYGQAGVSITELGVTASVTKVKPRLVCRELGRSRPPARAERGKRQAYIGGAWHSVRLFEMDELLPGNEIRGPAIVEHPATTLVIHPGDEVFVDEWSMLHYRHG